MDKWTSDQVANVVGALGADSCWQNYAKIVRTEELDGRTFRHISQESLVKVGVREVHAEAIVKARDDMIARGNISPPQSASLSPSPSSPPQSDPASPASPPAYPSDGGKVLQCPVHQRPFEAFCEQDQQLVCVNCMINHRGHHFSSIDDVFLQEKAEIEQLVEKATERSKVWLNAAESVVLLEKQLQANHRRVAAEVDHYFLSIEQRIRERREAIQAELMRVVEEKSQILSKQASTLGSAGSELQGVGVSVQQLLKTKSAVECLSKRQEIRQQLKQDNPSQGLGKSKEEFLLCEPQCDAHLEFVGEDKAIGDIIPVLGELHGGDWGVAQNCEAVGRGLEVVGVGLTGEFLIVSKNGKGEVVKKGKDPFRVRVTSGDTDKSVELVQQNEGTFKCTYDVDEDGRNPVTVFITLRGVHIPGSPFTVKVKLRENPSFLPAFCGKNITLSENNTVATKTGGGGGSNWSGAVLADGAQSFRVKILSGVYTMVGFATNAMNKEGNDHNKNNQSTYGYYLHIYGGTLFARGVMYKPFLQKCSQPETVIDCIWESEKGEIWFGVNGRKPQLAFQGIPPNVKLFLAVEFYDHESAVKLLDN